MTERTRRASSSLATISSRSQRKTRGRGIASLVSKLTATVAAAALAVCTFAVGERVARADDGTGEKPVHSDPASPDAWHVALGVDTDAPLDIAGRFSIETPGRLRLSTSLGTTPQGYTNAIDGFLRGVNAYDAATSALFKAGFSKTLVWRTHVGVRPFENHGFYIDGGYALVRLTGDTSAAAVAGAAGYGADAGALGSDTSFQLSTMVHMLDAELGWEIPLGEGFRLRTAVGGAFTVASTTAITSSAGDSAMLAAAGKEVDHAFTSYGFLPVVTVGLDYRLF